MCGYQSNIEYFYFTYHAYTKEDCPILSDSFFILPMVMVVEGYYSLYL